MAAFVREGAASLGIDEAMIAAPVLGVLAGAIGATRAIALSDDWHELPTIWMIVVARSGAGKTPALKLASKPLHDAQAIEQANHAEAMAEYAEAKQAHERDAKRGRDAGHPPAPPIARVYLTIDPTREAITPLLRDNPRGFPLVRSEMSGWLGSFGRYQTGGRSADAAAWCEMYDGNPWIEDRKTHGRTYVPRTCLCMASGIQPDLLTQCIDESHQASGLLARMTLCAPPVRPRRWRDGRPMSASTRDMYDTIVKRLLNLSPGADGEPVTLLMSEGAEEVWAPFFDEIAEALLDADDLHAAMLSKLKTLAARLALVIQVTTDAAEGRDHAEIGRDAMLAAVALAQWFGAEAKRIYGMFAETDGDKHTRKLLEWIDRRGGSATPRDLTHGLHRYRNDTEGARRALDALVAAGYGTWNDPKPSKKGGRPTKCFVLHRAATDPGGIPEMAASDAEFTANHPRESGRQS
jgi:hypothetical protein